MKHIKQYLLNQFELCVALTREFTCFNRLRGAVQQLEENEDDLVLEIENIANERHHLELKHHEKCGDNETLKITIAEEVRLRDNLESEKTVVLRKLEAAQKKNNEWTS